LNPGGFAVNADCGQGVVGLRGGGISIVLHVEQTIAFVGLARGGVEGLLLKGHGGDASAVVRGLDKAADPEDGGSCFGDSSVLRG